MKNIKKLAVMSLVVLLCAGCGSKTIPTLENGDQVITTLKDDKKISVKDLYNELKNKYGLDTLISLIDKMILEDKYKDQLEEAKKYGETTINQLKDSYGDELLSAIKYYTSYNTVEDYQASLSTYYLQQKAITDYAKGEIKDSEIKDYYKNEVKEDIKLSHILISVNYSDDASEEDKTNAENDAKNKAQEVINKLKESNNIEETFKELAKEYSDDDSTKNDGGNLGFINVDTLGDNYKDVVSAAYKLKDGAYSSEAIKSSLGYHVILRLETKEKASLDEVRSSILDKLAEKYTTEHNDAQVKAMQNLRKEYDMDIVDDDLHSEYVTYIQNTLASLQANANSKTNSNSQTK